MRILAISDLHVDKPQNLMWVETLSLWDYQDDVLIVAGDISDALDRLKITFELLTRRFQKVFYVPGNHELWIRENHFSHSLEKWEAIETLCRQYAVATRPALVGQHTANPVWIVPLLGWYIKPEDGEGSLFLPKPGEDPTLSMWADNYHVKWPATMNTHEATEYFLRRNKEHFVPVNGHPVITFSHFLPRQELIFPENFDPQKGAQYDRFPAFNFSRVAGCWQLDEQLRQWGATIHVYGHQHRNRDRTIDGVRYISYCLGYPEERDSLGWNIHTPLVIWDSQAPVLPWQEERS